MDTNHAALPPAEGPHQRPLPEAPPKPDHAPANQLPPNDRQAQWNFTAWAIASAVLIALCAGIYIFVTALFPVQWAHTVAGNFSDPAAQWLAGICCGGIFVFFPLLVFWQIRRRTLSWLSKIGLALLAIILAFPNLATLGIFIGQSPQAEEAQEIMIRQTESFPIASCIGAILGALVFLAVIIKAAVSRHRAQRLRELEAKLDSRH